MIGMEKTRALAALPPAQRVALLAKLRAAAAAAFEQATVLEKAADVQATAQVAAASLSPVDVSGNAPAGASGASGASSAVDPDYLGSTLFAGE